MNPTQFIVITFLLASTLSEGTQRSQIVQNAKPLSKSPDLQGNRWTPLNIAAKKIKGLGRVISFSSLNADLVYTIHDSGDGKQVNKVCYMWALVNNTLYGSVNPAFDRDFCANSSVTKINQQGSVLLLNGDQSFSYINSQGTLSPRAKIQGDLRQVGIKHIELGLTKSTDSFANDFFRLFSRASDVNGNYPDHFYALVSNTTKDSFTDSDYSTLTLQETKWEFKETTEDVKFSSIDQVNFVSSHDPEWVLEGQWITGYGPKAAGDPTAAPACQYGAVQSDYFINNQNSQNSMYMKSLSFPCIMHANERTYQGIVALNTANKYFYAINPNSGEIQVCSEIPTNFRETIAFTNFTRSCVFSTKIGLKLTPNEYYSDVGVLGAGDSRLTVVNIRNKAVKFALRQVVVDFSGASNLPTFDAETYFYSVHDKSIYRMRKAFMKDQTIHAEFYDVVSDQEEEIEAQIEQR